uniref:Uncharacterized protein n=1 Tax=Anas platyrhynchos platyrhynchos TaxID=8840 RepID=A0A493TJK0_ANAPP
MIAAPWGLSTRPSRGPHKYHSVLLGWVQNGGKLANQRKSLCSLVGLKGKDPIHDTPEQSKKAFQNPSWASVPLCSVRRGPQTGQMDRTRPCMSREACL